MPHPSCCLNVDLLSPSTFLMQNMPQAKGTILKGKGEKRWKKPQEISVIIYSQFELFSTILQD